jgi:hypothetical protein
VVADFLPSAIQEKIFLLHQKAKLLASALERK